MTNISTTELPTGITNAALNSVLQTYGAMDPTVFHTYFNDFDTYTAGDWTNTATGSVTNANAAGSGGILSLGNSAANNDLDSLQLKAASFAITASEQAWFKARFQVSSALNSALVLGLIQTTTTPLTVTDGIYFAKAAASTTLTAKVAKSSSILTTNVGTLVDATYVNVGWHYNANSGAVILYLNGTNVARIAVTTSQLPTVNLNLTIAVANGTAAANTLLMDYAFVSLERPSTLL